VNVVLFGGLNRRLLAPGWTKETVIAIFGGGDLDLSSSPPGRDARLTAVAILGGLDILVAPGTRVSVSGVTLFGSRDVNVSQRGDGPEIKMSLSVVLGNIEVKEISSSAAVG
jgi:predicted membrane protein